MSSMKLSQSIPWPRIFAEGAIIVVSILLAFWVDAWWEDRKDRAEEERIVGLIHAEAVANRQLFAEHRQLHQGIVDAGLRLLERTGPNAEVEDHEIDELIGDLATFIDWWTVEPSVGAVASILQSGQISLIESGELRVELAAWESLVEDVRGNEAVVLRFSDGVLGDYWYENAPYRSVFPSEIIGESRFAIDIEAILRDRRFESLVHNKMLTEMGILEDYRELEASTARLVSLSSGDPEMD
jgi:hypothetical protein